MPTEKRHLLITGLPGTGKTTILIELVRRFSRFSPAGFYTEEVRQHGQRRGFGLKGLDGSEGVLADVSLHAPHRIGHYAVDVQAFEQFLAALDLPGNKSRLIFIDEIGKMECLSRRFVSLAKSLLDSDKTVVATVARKGAGFIEEVKQRGDVQLVEVTPSNRNALPQELTGWLEQRLQQ